MRTLENPYKFLEQHGNILFPPAADTLYIAGDNQQLVSVVRVCHTYDPDSQDIGEICSAWKIHQANTMPENRESLCEGTPKPLPDGDVTNLIILGNERMLQQHLARLDGIPVDPLDADNRTEFEAVLAMDVDPAAELYYATLRHWTHYAASFEAQVKGPLLQQLATALERYKTYLPEALREQFADVGFEDLHTHFFNRPFAHDLADPFFPFDQTISFWKTDTEIQKVAVIWNDYRDMQQILKKIQESFGRGKSPFCVLGWQHGYRLEEELKKLGRQLTRHELQPGSHLPIPGLVGTCNYNPLDRPWQYQ